MHDVFDCWFSCFYVTIVWCTVFSQNGTFRISETLNFKFDYNCDIRFDLRFAHHCKSP